MLRNTKGLLEKLLAICKGLKKVECLGGGADFGNRPGGFVAWGLCQKSIEIVWDNISSAPGTFNIGWSLGSCLCLLVECSECSFCNPILHHKPSAKQSSISKDRRG